jgi:4-hydroxythreonine-4-phosphate dehydrogenase
MTSQPPRIAISLGDPGGIGPEVTRKALTALQPWTDAVYIIHAPEALVKRDFAGLTRSQVLCDRPPATPLKPGLYVRHIDEAGPVFVGGPSRENGDLSFRSFRSALEEVRRGEADALTTAPISKHSWSLAEIPWAGHTDYLQHLYPEAMMTFWSADLRVALLTHHIPLKDAVKAVTRERLFTFLTLLDENLDRMGFGPRRILVAGLNPHAGEEGLLGTEENTEIRPAIAAARDKGIPVEGPFPPDILFRKAREIQEAFAVGLYHDQGLIAFKYEAFDQGVNTTLGLPFLRTSPDHGTAFDIAGKDQAHPESMIQSLKLARRYSKRMKKKRTFPAE